MPELPEVESMRRGVLAAVHRRIQRVSMPRGRSQSGLRRPLRPVACSPSATALRRSLAGRTVRAVERAGKRLVLTLASTRDGHRSFLVIEPRMTGLLLTSDPPTRSHVRLRIHFAGRPALELVFWDRRGLGTLTLVDARGLERLVGAGRLGDDALSIDGPGLRRALGGSSRAVKPALLDQRAVAGVGNIYACESLFAAGIDPTTPCRRIRPADWNRLAREMRSILSRAVACGGSTLPDATYLAGPGRPGTFQDHHRVYGREGRSCDVCGGIIRRRVQAQRSTFYCPVCQGAFRRRRPGGDTRRRSDTMPFSTAAKKRTT